jgi:hypothetical protein
MAAIATAAATATATTSTATATTSTAPTTNVLKISPDLDKQEQEVDSASQYLNSCDLLNMIKTCAYKSNFKLFGGAVRDEVRGKLPKDLDFMMPRSIEEYGYFVKLAPKVQLELMFDKLRDDFNIVQLADEPNLYPIEADQVVQYEFTSIKYPYFSIKADFVNERVFYNTPYVDVNCLFSDAKGLHCNPYCNLDMPTVIQHCKEKKFAITAECRKHAGKCSSKREVMFYCINNWIKGDYRIAKMLNDGWTLVTSDDENVPTLDVSSPDAVIDYLTKTRELMTYEVKDTEMCNRGSLMQVSNKDSCAICEQQMSDTYVYHFVCCQRQMHILCALNYVSNCRKAYNQFLNCPKCAGDPFGFKTSGVEHADVRHYHVAVRKHEYLERVYRYWSDIENSDDSDDSDKPEFKYVKRIGWNFKIYNFPDRAPKDATPVSIKTCDGYCMYIVEDGKGIIHSQHYATRSEYYTAEDKLKLQINDDQNITELPDFGIQINRDAIIYTIAHIPSLNPHDYRFKIMYVPSENI